MATDVAGKPVHLWFLDTEVSRLRSRWGDGPSVFEHFAAFEDFPPLHRQI